ncbi:MAG: hypothetical protein KBS75_08060, partial [Bacteroidales bacterium]|nr:hypothetical protein [Candidatus Equimonas faecalis]
MPAYLCGLPTAGRANVAEGGKWAESPMVCSPGQSDRRERRPGCMPICMAAATRQWVYHGASSYHVGGHVPTAGRANVAEGGKWAESPMVCSPGQSDRRERRP